MWGSLDQQGLHNNLFFQGQGHCQGLCQSHGQGHCWVFGIQMNFSESLVKLRKPGASKYALPFKVKVEVKVKVKVKVIVKVIVMVIGTHLILPENLVKIRYVAASR